MILGGKILNIFIGSSSEKRSLDIAVKIAAKIEDCGHKPILWTKYFNASDITLVKIMDLCQVVDGGIFVLASDDEIISNHSKFITRDNVLIEAGIFLGSLGLSQVALYKLPDVDIPSDFLGITYIEDSDKEFNIQLAISKWIDGFQKNIDKKRTTNMFLSQKHLDRLEFEELIASANEEIMISSFFMSIFSLSKEMENAIFRGVKIRLLIADIEGENFAALVTMLDGLNANITRAKNKLASTLQFLLELYRNDKVKDNLEIRTIDYVFPSRVTIIDPSLENGQMYVHLSSYKNRNATEKNFRLTKEDSYFDVYKQEFEMLWEDAKPIDFEKINV